MRRHIKRLHFQCSENFNSIESNKLIFCHLNRDLNGTEHNYNIQIYNSINGNYGLAIYLCMKNSDSNDILVYRDNYDTLKEAQKDAIRVVLELEKADLSEEIKEWKNCNVNPIFDEKLNHVGDVYTAFQILKKDQKSFDYYNTNPLKCLYGRFYKLIKENDKVSYNVIDSNYDSVTSHVGKDKTLLNKMVNKIKAIKSYNYVKFK